jgi:hypothetical protein
MQFQIGQSLDDHQNNPNYTKYIDESEMDNLSPKDIVHSPAGQVFASIEGPSTAYRLSDGKPSAEKTSTGAAAQLMLQPAQ